MSMKILGLRNFFCFFAQPACRHRLRPPESAVLFSADSGYCWPATGASMATTSLRHFELVDSLLLVLSILVQRHEFLVFLLDLLAQQLVGETLSAFTSKYVKITL
jgi:hypothetical protein